jgi:2'-5' RNA ligase
MLPGGLRRIERRSMYRLFIAVDLPETVKNSIRAICGGLPDARWVDVRQLHLTLRFIGEVGSEMFNEIKNSMGEVSETCFNLALKGIGCFPPKKSPRVLWVGIENNETLIRLADKVERVLVEINGLEPEHRKFSPHITIARFRESTPAKIAEYLDRHSSFYTESFPVDAFHLYSSTLTRAGAEHKLEASYPLK